MRATRRSNASTRAPTSSSSKRETDGFDGRALSLHRRYRRRRGLVRARRGAPPAARSRRSRPPQRGRKRSSRSFGRPGTTPSPHAAWASASSTTSRSPRAPFRPPPSGRARRATRACSIVDFDYHHGNGTEAVAGDGLSYLSDARPIRPIRAPARRAIGAADDVIVNVPLPSTGVSTEAFVARLGRVAAGRRRSACARTC